MSEFDIDEPNDTDQLAQYQIYFPLFWDDPGVKGMTLWGYIQSDVWDAHPNTYLLRTDGSERPALQWLRNYIQKGPVPAVPLLVSPRSINEHCRSGRPMSGSLRSTRPRMNFKLHWTINFS